MLLVDCQASGASPKFGQPIEVAWCVTDAVRAAEVGLDDVTSRLVALSAGVRLNRRVSDLTGIKTSDLIDAPGPEAVFQELASAGTDHVAVAHFARFERSFFDHWAEEFAGAEARRFAYVCTHEIARRLWPDLPRRGLRPLSGYLGHLLPETKRSAGHVVATARVWHDVVRQLAEEHEVSTLAELTTWIAGTRERRTGKRAYPLPRGLRLGLPSVPGVYRMLARGGEVLYVGKATSLKDRVNSHFRGRNNGGRPQTRLEMLTQVWGLDVTETGSALEAALLETDEIKRLDPPYNTALKASEPTVWFADPELSELVGEPDDRHPVGPLPSRGALESYAALATVLADPGQPSLATLRLAMGVREPWGPPDALLRAGLEVFTDSWGRPDGLAGLGAVSLSLWEEAQSSDEEEEADGEDATGRTWDPEAIASSLERTALRGGQLLRRAPMLCRVVDAVVRFRPKGAPHGSRRQLTISDGHVTAALEVDPEHPLPEVPHPGRDVLQRQRAFDVPMHDRLRVLLTELRRVATEGGAIVLETASGEHFDERELAFRLARF